MRLKVFYPVLLLAPLLMIYGSLKWLKINKKTVRVKNLDAGLKGLKILQISDFHGEPFKKSPDILSKIQKEAVDIIVITGDFLDRHAAYLPEEHKLLLKQLAMRAPTFFIEGNHEYYTMHQLAPVLKEMGIIHLRNEKKTLTVNGSLLEIIGFTDFYTTDLKKYAHLLEQPSGFRLILSHQPQAADHLPIENAPGLMLCGHTHGGQIRLPFFPTLFAPGQGFFPKYGYGFFRKGKAIIYVSKGLSYTKRLPVRFFNRPEICIFTPEN